VTYCTRQELEDAFGADVIAELEGERANAVAEAIADAAFQIDGYIAARYPLPLATVPGLLRTIARNLVRYSLDIDPDDKVKARRDEAISYLRDIAAGRATLGLPQAAEPASLDTAQVESAGNVFARDKSKGFI